MAAMDFPPSPTIGDKYPVTPIAGQPQYTWDGEKWTTAGAQITTASPASALPLMDGVSAQVGVAAKYAREDHVHPSDSAKLGVGQAVRYDVAQGLTSAQMAQGRANINVPTKNYIVNGAMQHSQENGFGTLASGFGYYPADMFTTANAGSSGSYTYQLIINPTAGGSSNRIRATVSVVDTSVAAGDVVFFYTRIEGYRIADLKFGGVGAKTVTLQFGTRAPAGTYGVAFMNGSAARGYIGQYVISAGEANTDVVKSITVPGDVTGTWDGTNGVGLDIRWTLMAGTTYQGTAGAWGVGNLVATSSQFNWMGTAGNTWDLYDVGLYEGSSAPPFTVPDFANELLACQRYWSTGDIMMQSPVAGSMIQTMPFKAIMRAIPTVTITLVDAGNGTMVVNGAVADTKSTAIQLTASATGGYARYVYKATARM